MKRFLLPLALLLTACSTTSMQSDDNAMNGRMPTAHQELAQEHFTAPVHTGTGSVRLLSSGVTEIGNHDAENTLVVYVEPHCDYCRELVTDHIERLKTDVLASGNIRILIAIHELEKYPNSTLAHQALICAGKQDASADMLTALFTNTSNDQATLVSQMTDWGKDTETFTTCLTSDETQKLRTTQRLIAKDLSVTLVPTLFLNGDKQVGLPYYADLKGWIKEELED